MHWKPPSYLALSVVLALPLGAEELAPRIPALAYSQAAIQTEAPAQTEAKTAGSSRQQIPPKGASRALELNNVALTFGEQGNLQESESSYREALKTWEEWGGPENPGLIATLNGLANVLRLQGSYFEAQRLFQRAITIGEKLGEPAHFNLGFSLNSLGALYCDQHQPSRAIPLLKRALEIREQMLGPKNPLLAASWNNLGDALVLRRSLDEAEQLYRRSLEVLRDPAAPPFLTAVTDYKLAELHFRHGKADTRRLSKAEEFYGHTVADLEGTPSQGHPLMGMALRGLAEVYLAQQRYSEAEPLLKRALELQEKILGPQHLQVAKVLFDYAELLRKTRNRREAAAMKKRAKSIIKAFEDEHLGRGETVDFSTLQPR